MSGNRDAFEQWYNNHFDMELITGPDDVEAAWEIWKAATELSEHKIHTLECIVADLRAELESNHIADVCAECGGDGAGGDHEDDCSSSAAPHHHRSLMSDARAALSTHREQKS